MIDEPPVVESRDGKHPGQRIHRLTGRMTFPTPDDDLKFFNQILGGPAPSVILDLSAVSFCDSSGVGELMKIHTTCKREKRRLALVVSPGKVQFVLRVAQVLEYFTVYATVEEAEAALI